MPTITYDRLRRDAVEHLEPEELARLAGALLEAAGVSRETVEAMLDPLGPVNREELIAQLEDA